MATALDFLLEIQRAKAGDCSGFLKTLCEKLGAPLPPLTADGLIEHISMGGGGGWVLIGKGKSFGDMARGYAQKGHLVVALLKAKDHYPFKKNPKTGKYDIPRPYSHGHVSVVLPTVGNGGYPMLVSGSIVADGRSEGNKSVAGVWRGVDAANVSYYRTMGTFTQLQGL